MVTDRVMGEEGWVGMGVVEVNMVPTAHRPASRRGRDWGWDLVGCSTEVLRIHWRLVVMAAAMGMVMVAEMVAVMDTVMGGVDSMEVRWVR